MDKMKNLIKKTLIQVFPAYESIKANKKINEDMTKIENESIGLTYMANYESMDLKNAEKFLERTFEYRKLLEGKARTSVFAIAISASLIVGLCQIIFNVNSSIQNSTFLKIVIVIFAAFALLYMIMAGVLSLKVLGWENRNYELFPQDVILQNQEKLKMIAMCTELNVKLNHIRNNYIYTSYKNIINALICLGILFLLTTIPSIIIKEGTPNKIEVDKGLVIQEIDKLKEFKIKEKTGIPKNKRK